MTHLSDQQLIEIHYLGEAEETTGHLAKCEDCAARLRRTVAELERAAGVGLEGVESRPESFWQRQRTAIERKIDRGSDQPARYSLRWAAAAAGAAVLAAGLFSVPRVLSYRNTQPVAAALPAPTTPATSTALDVIEDISSLDDPWESEELRSYGAAVEWESWETEHQKTRNNS